MTQTAFRGPLEGYRVLELGNYIAAPFAGRLLADFGAEVIKIERPVIGDELRNWRLHEGSTSLLFRTINRNKKSVVLDLKTDAGRDAVLRLVADADVVLENFRPGTLEHWGLGPEELTRANPDIVISRVSAFGQFGPLSTRPGFAAIAESFGGLRELVGDADRPPVRVGISLGDSIAGIYAALGAVMCLLDRSRANSSLELERRTVDVALYEAVFSMMESLVPDYSAHGIVRQRIGGRVEGIAPSNAYRTQNGQNLLIAGNGDAIFRRLMEVIGRPDLRDEPGLQDNAGRWRERDRLDEAIAEWAGRLPIEFALARLEEAEVPAGRIYTAADIVADEHYEARGMIQRMSVSTGERVLDDVAFPGIVPILGSRPRAVDHLGPDLGEHTQEVLESLGLEPTELRQLLDAAAR